MQPAPGNEAAFYGGSFTALSQELQERLLQLTDRLLEEGVIGSVRLSTRPDCLDAAELDFLAAHRVRLVELGVQSLDDEVLAAAGRGHTAMQAEQALELLKACGFQTGMQLMVGLPRQSFASVRATADRAAALRPDVARIYPVLVLKDTPLAAQYACGAFAPLSLREAVRQSACVYDTLVRAGVRVIRTGLQADEELCAPGNILAGPFHPSLGELVRGYLLRERLTPMLAAVQGDVLLSFPAALESQVRGHKNSNLRYWAERFSGKTISLRKSGGAGEIRVLPLSGGAGEGGSHAAV